MMMCLTLSICRPMQDNSRIYEPILVKFGEELFHVDQNAPY